MALVESKVARAAYDVIIDNILVAHNDPTQLQALCDTFHSVCRRYNATIGEYVSPRQIVEHRGMEIDFGSSTVAIKTAWLQRFAQKIEYCKKYPTWAKIASVIGMLVWALLILNEAPRLGPLLIELASSRSRMTSKKPHVDKMPQMESAVACVLRNTPTTTVEAPFPTSWIASDATPYSWAFVTWDGHELKVCSGFFEQEYPIARAEATAILYAVRSLHPAVSWYATNILVDNTAALNS